MERASKERVKVFPPLNGGSKDWRGGGGSINTHRRPFICWLCDQARTVEGVLLQQRGGEDGGREGGL